MTANAKAPPNFKAPEYWKNLNLPFNIGSGRSSLFGPDTQKNMRLWFYQNSKNQNLVGRAWFGPALEGPPGHVHGGISAFVLDEAMGSAAWMKGYPVVAKQITVDFKNLTPTNQLLEVSGGVRLVQGRDIQVFAKICIKDEVLTQATGTFHHLSQKRLTEMADQEAYQLDMKGLVFPQD